MFDVWMTLAATTHLLAFGCLIIWACRKAALPQKDWPFALYIVIWTSLVLACHLSSTVKAMNDLGVFTVANVAGLGLLGLLFLYVERAAATKPLLAPPAIEFAPLHNARVRRFLSVFLPATLALALILSVVIGLSVYPDNADSMIYRLPRTFWYVSNGSFLHPFDALDKRVTFYPLDGVTLYVPLVLYNLPGTAHSLPSLASWALLVYAAYRFARDLGAEHLIALFAAWLVGLTPSILAQATSTNDEILAATALLSCLYMLWRWLLGGRAVHFLLAAMALGLSVGTKLHILFLSPVVVAALALAAWSAAHKPSLLRQWMNALNSRAVFASLGMLIILILPFLLYNYLSTGRVYFFGEFEHDVFNLAASVHCVFQNLLIYLSQMVFAPIADLNSWPVANDRQYFNNLLNAAIDPWIRPFIDPDPKFYHLGYRYVGVTLPVSVRFVEFSLWSGFVWMLWPFQARLALKTRFPLHGLFFLIALTPPIWLLFWCFITLYMEGTATYFTFYLICAAPAAAFAFAKIRRPIWDEIRWSAIVFVTLTNLVICGNLLMFSGFRALPDLFYSKTWPYDWDLMEPRIIEEIRRANDIRIMLLHEKMPYFAFMHWNPRARYYDPYPEHVAEHFGNILHIFPISSLDRYGYFVLKIPGKKTVGATYLGAMRGIGREAIFGMGNDVEKRYPAESTYIIPQLVITPNNNGSDVLLRPGAFGLTPKDELEFRHEITFDGKTIFERDWSRTLGFNLNIEGYDPFQRAALLTIHVRSALSHKELTHATVNVGGNGAWLPDGSEY